MLIVVKVSEIERKRAYKRQGYPKGTMKAINRASCWSRLLVTPTAITCIRMRNRPTHARTLAIAQHS